MKISTHRLIIPGLVVLCGLAAVALIPAVHLSRTDVGTRKESPRAVPALGLNALNEAPPTMPEVVEKHLFVAQRKATGQNAFPDLIVKGVFLGTENSAVFSLKSTPQANLRVWAGRTDSALAQVTNPRDPRQPIVAFLREWSIKEISSSGVTVEHSITGEKQTYAVNYTPVAKVKDDASRGYGQGIIPQGGEVAAGTGARTATGNNPMGRGGQFPSDAPPPVNVLANRVSEIMQRMSPDQQKNFLKQIGQDSSGANQKTDTSGQSSSQNKSKTTTKTKSAK
ncbi:MAG: hypothetical protein WCH86_00230 [Kiritimatiellales bacterium]